MWFKIPSLMAVLAAVVLSGCAGLAPDREPEDLWYVTLKPGSRVEVQRVLTAPSGARISLQNGRLLLRGDIVEWRQYCQFRVRRPQDQMSEPLRIEPDTFVVQRTYRRIDHVWEEGARYAFVDEDFVNSPSPRTMATYMELHSDAQPDVMHLDAAVYRGKAVAHHAFG